MKIQNQVSLQPCESLVSSERRELGAAPDPGLCISVHYGRFFPSYLPPLLRHTLCVCLSFYFQ